MASVAGVVALVATGCLSSTLSVEVDPDGKVTSQVQLTLSRDALDVVERELGQRLTTEQLVEEYTSGGDVAEAVEVGGGGIGVRIVSTYDSVADFNDHYAQDKAGPEAFETLVLRRLGDQRWRLEATARSVDTLSQQAAELDPDLTPVIEGFRGLGGGELAVTFALPGAVAETNGEVVGTDDEGRSMVRWDLLEASGTSELVLETEPPGALARLTGNKLALAAGGLAALAALGALVVVAVMVLRRRGGPVMAQPPGQYPASKGQYPPGQPGQYPASTGQYPPGQPGQYPPGQPGQYPSAAPAAAGPVQPAAQPPVQPPTQPAVQPPGAQPPGWYRDPDPGRPGGWRWWDGTGWTSQVRE